MKTSILHIRWLAHAPQRLVFASKEDAVQSAHVMCAKLKIKPEGKDWKEKLSKGEVVRASGMVLEVEETEFHSDALTTEDELPSPEIPSTYDPIYQYVLMRRDVPDYLSGKACAQASHAGTAMIIRAYRSKKKPLIDLVEEWDEADGFGTCIVLLVSASEMRQAVSYAGIIGLHAGIVHDPSYPIRDGEKIQTLPIDTCAFVFGRKSECTPIVGRFPLLKEPYEK